MSLQVIEVNMKKLSRFEQPAHESGLPKTLQFLMCPNNSSVHEAHIVIDLKYTLEILTTPVLSPIEAEVHIAPQVCV